MEIRSIGAESVPGHEGHAHSERESQRVDELRRRDREVRAHEQAHKAAAGSYARGGPSFEYERGPDGKLYAVGGEVSIDTSEVSGDPQATVRKMQQIRRAALAPANPSAQDRQIAAEALQKEREARAEAAQESRDALESQGPPSPYDGYTSPESRGSMVDLQL